MCKSVKLSLIIIQSFHSKFIGCESFQGSNIPKIFFLFEKHLKDSIYNSNLSAMDCLPLG